MAHIKLEKNGSPPTLNDIEQAAKLLTSSKSSRNARLSWDLGLPKHLHGDITKASSLRDVRRRSSPTVWDLKKETIPEGLNIKVYKRRWIVLFIYVLYAFVGTFQWSMYAIIANVITKYYKVSNLSVDFTTMSFLICYLVAFLPASWILNTWGIRWSMLIGCLLNALGCFLRIFSVPADRFWLSMFGQCIVGLSQVFAPMLSTRIAAVWFPANQVSFACATGFNGILVGNAVGFLVPPLLVRNSDNHADIAQDLNRVYIILATSAAVSFLLTAAFFQEEPPLPPSQAQKLQRIRETAQNSTESLREFFGSLKRLLTKRAYIILLISFSLIVGVFCALATLLNQVLIPHFPGHEHEIGIVGLVLVVAGIISSGICGFILDRTHAFKKTNMALYLLTLAGWIAFSVLLQFGDMTWMYVSSAILGFATTGMQPVGLEFAVEITYPEPEGTSSGLLCAIAQLCGVLCTLLYGCVLDAWGDNVANAVLGVPIVLACIMMAFIRPRLKRQAAQQMEIPVKL